MPPRTPCYALICWYSDMIQQWKMHLSKTGSFFRDFASKIISSRHIVNEKAFNSIYWFGVWRNYLDTYQRGVYFCHIVKNISCKIVISLNACWSQCQILVQHACCHCIRIVIFEALVTPNQFWFLFTDQPFQMYIIFSKKIMSFTPFLHSHHCCRRWCNRSTRRYYTFVFVVLCAHHDDQYASSHF